MNRYGNQLLKQWEIASPQFVSSLEDPQAHFTQMGVQVEQEIQELLPSLEGNDPPNEDYLVKVGRLQAARREAEEIVLEQYRPPSDSPGPDEPENWDSMTPDEQEAWLMENLEPGEERDDRMSFVNSYRIRWEIDQEDQAALDERAAQINLEADSRAN